MIFYEYKQFEFFNIEELKELIKKNPIRKRANIKNPKSAMMLNPLKLKHLNRIDNLNADIIIINLEDGINPNLKKRALYLTTLFLSHLTDSKSLITIRVNPLNEGGREEIEVLNRVSPDAIRVSKIDNSNDVEEVVELIDSDIDIHLSIETKEALKNLTTLNIDNRVKIAYLGILDMLNSFEIPQTILTFNNPTIDYILSKFLIDSKIANLIPFSFLYQDYKNLEEFKKWCYYVKNMGYDGKSCLGPLQVEIANEIFKKDDEEIERAKYIKREFEKMQRENINGFIDKKYGFIDEPIYKDALLTLGYKKG